MTVDLAAQAREIMQWVLIGVAMGFGTGSLWKWFQWFRG